VRESSRNLEKGDVHNETATADDKENEADEEEGTEDDELRAVDDDVLLGGGRNLLRNVLDDGCSVRKQLTVSQ
jgi:hypothetical protein